MNAVLLERPWLVVGGGRLGLAVAQALLEAGASVQVAVRSAERRAQIAAAQRAGWLPAALAVVTDWQQAIAPCVWLAVPDRALATLASEVCAATDSPSAARPEWVVHGAGAFGADVIRPVGAQWRAACVHPLCAIPDAAVAPAGQPLRGALMALDTAAADLADCTALAAALGGLPAVVPAAQRAAYHAAAALVANDLAALMHVGEALFAGVGVAQPVARAGLLHLARSSLGSLQMVPAGQPWLQGLTGAVARGDAATLQRHLDALAGQPAAQLHRALSLYLTRALAADGLHPAKHTAALLDVLHTAEQLDVRCPADQ